MSHQRKTYPRVIEQVVSVKEKTNVKNRQKRRAMKGPKVKHYTDS